VVIGKNIVPFITEFIDALDDAISSALVNMVVPLFPGCFITLQSPGNYYFDAVLGLF